MGLEEAPAGIAGVRWVPNGADTGAGFLKGGGTRAGRSPSAQPVLLVLGSRQPTTTWQAATAG